MKGTGRGWLLRSNYFHGDLDHPTDFSTSPTKTVQYVLPACCTSDWQAPWAHDVMGVHQCFYVRGFSGSRVFDLFFSPPSRVLSTFSNCENAIFGQFRGDSSNFRMISADKFSLQGKIGNLRLALPRKGFPTLKESEDRNAGVHAAEQSVLVIKVRLLS